MLEPVTEKHTFENVRFHFVEDTLERSGRKLDAFPHDITWYFFPSHPTRSNKSSKSRFWELKIDENWHAHLQKKTGTPGQAECQPLRLLSLHHQTWASRLGSFPLKLRIQPWTWTLDFCAEAFFWRKILQPCLNTFWMGWQHPNASKLPTGWLWQGFPRMCVSFCLVDAIPCEHNSTIHSPLMSTSHHFSTIGLIARDWRPLNSFGKRIKRNYGSLQRMANEPPSLSPIEISSTWQNHSAGAAALCRSSAWTSRFYDVS